MGVKWWNDIIRIVDLQDPGPLCGRTLHRGPSPVNYFITATNAIPNTVNPIAIHIV